ncbi:uncharacterized protein LOC118349651 [Juglans regia]|uniref:Uncharacterized protein LOC118349651 n=1 Tax=Juglans regia TaxID=51240 RepID=A0A6P9F580_JUGRE|nr:uncharacterized protein LOC118349651 [Juglans regia]
MEGAELTEKSDIAKGFNRLLSAVFQSSKPSPASINQCTQGVVSRVTDEMLQQLDRPCTVEEVEVALRQMSPFKSPGPDGFSAGFYQDHWKIVSHDVSKAVIYFFIHRNLPKGWNHTHLVLIPKVKSPTSVREFRPISLCNVNYKLISMVLANRMKGILGKVICWNQSAFILNRLITDNIMVAYELLHSMHSKRKGRAGSMAIKLDMSKAYDRVEWDFLAAMLLKLGFSQNWTDLVMECVKSVSYSVVINGEPGKEILVKSVLQAIPTYTMSIFKLPILLLKEIETLLARFWWHHKGEGRGIHWKTWSSLGLVKNQDGLGFRDLSRFNKALLAKPVWRLMTDPHSLVSRVFKQKYFRKCDLLEVELKGSSSSFLWKSIWSSLELLKEGTVWRIGNGASIKISKDKWLPRPVTYQVQTPPNTLDPESRVEVLMDTENRSWKKDLVAAVFKEEEAKCSKKGTFSVKSAYFLATSLKGRYSGEGSKEGGNSDWWKALWRLEVPGKLLWSDLINLLTKENLELALVLMYHLWARRNAFIFQNQFSQPGSVSAKAQAELSLFCECNTVNKIRVEDSIRKGSTVIWKPPDQPFVKGNFDAAFNKTNGRMGMGIVIRDHADNTWLGQLIEDLQQFLVSNPSWQLNFVHRQANKVAHTAAQLAISNVIDCFWLNDGPPEVKSMVLKDVICSV